MEVGLHVAEPPHDGFSALAEFWSRQIGKEKLDRFVLTNNRAFGDRHIHESLSEGCRHAECNACLHNPDAVANAATRYVFRKGSRQQHCHVSFSYALVVLELLQPCVVPVPSVFQLPQNCATGVAGTRVDV